MKPTDLIRCPWCIHSEIERQYHDNEWGVPLWDDNKLFEFIVLDGFQAGLSWKIVLDKRENFRRAFFGFDAHRLVECGPAEVDLWMQDAGLIRNRLKLVALSKNAAAFLATKAEFGRFADYIWSFVGGKPVQTHRQPGDAMVTVSPEAEVMSKDMKKRGFKFCGPTICYAFMQAAGLINDHRSDCFRYSELLNQHPA